MTLLDGPAGPPEVPARKEIDMSAFSDRPAFNPNHYDMEKLFWLVSGKGLVGRQSTFMLSNGLRVNGEVVGYKVERNNDNQVLQIAVRSYENDLYRYYFINTAFIQCIETVDRERISVRRAQKVQETSQEDSTGHE